MRILLTIVAVLFSMFGVMSGSLALAAMPLVAIAAFWFLSETDRLDDIFKGK